MYWPALRPSGRNKSDLEVSGGEWDPFTPLRREMERLFDNFGRDYRWPACLFTRLRAIERDGSHAATRLYRLWLYRPLAQ